MNLYLSPHHDDVCFSIGHLASRQGGALINLFTTSRYVAAPMELPGAIDEQVAVITGLRRAEDEAFTGAAGLTRHDLGFSEPPVLGRRPFDLEDQDQAVAELSARLTPYLLALLDGGGPDPAMLFCPMGIGGHRDHLATFLAIRGIAAQLSNRCALLLYEDLHYASNPLARRAGLQRAEQVFAGSAFTAMAVRMTAQEAARKMELVGLYASQHSAQPRLAQFTPASELAPEPHEIVWRVSWPSAA